MLGRILIIVGILLIGVGLLLEPLTKTSPAQTQANIVNATAKVEPSAAPLATQTPERVSNGAVAQTVLPVESPPLENIIWHDSFADEQSGWERRYVVPGSYEDSRLVNWNGYENGAYVFSQNGVPTVDGTNAISLWDFHGDIRLPEYPYTVRADTSVHPAGNAMVLLDYSGDFVDINNGHGLAVVWGETDGLAYQLVDAWPVTVYEFHSGHTWMLSCTSSATSAMVGIISTMVVDVYRDALRVRLYASDGLLYRAECRRLQAGQSDQQRFLGIGAVYPRPAVPANDYNQVHFEDVYLMQSSLAVSPGELTGSFQEILSGCDVTWMGGYSAEQLGNAGIPITTVLADRTLCLNRYASYASDFPGYGPVRVDIPDMSALEGNWYCGSEAPTSRFALFRENDYLRALIDDRMFYVFAANQIIPHGRGYTESEIVPFGYMVRSSPSGGDPQTFRSVPFVSIGHGIGVYDEMRYYFTVNDSVIRPNWTPRECYKQ